jgi:small subunit ribosomal protein S16
MGSKKRPFYRLVAADSRSPRDGRFLETLGYYNPMVEPAEIKLDEDKIYKWLDNGAEPTVNAENILKKVGLLERWQLLKSGVAIAELDAKIEERRAKQPRATAKDKPKLSKKAIAAQKAEEEKKAEESEAAAEEKSDAALEAAEDTKAEPSGDAAVEKVEENPEVENEQVAEGEAEAAEGEAEETEEKD